MSAFLYYTNSSTNTISNLQNQICIIFEYLKKIHFWQFSGFDFDLDEVWAPLSPHLKNVHRNHLESSSSASSSSSLYSGNRKSDARKAMGFDGRARIDDDPNDSVIFKLNISKTSLAQVFLPVEHRSYSRDFKISSTILTPPTPITPKTFPKTQKRSA